jgi:hypothetical protein
MDPKSESWIIGVDGVTEEEMREIQKWARTEAGDEWGNTIPSIRINDGEPGPMMSRISLEDFASAIRYDDAVYKTECPVFKHHGIEALLK